jgi:NHS family xanthosine MFS transporter
MIIVSCIVYGMAFDFFNISGSLFVETTTDAKTRSSAQGLFMMMTNGFGAVLGSVLSGILIAKYFTLKFTSIQTLCTYFKATPTDKSIQELLKENEVLFGGTLKNTVKIYDWPPIWLTFAVYSFVILVLFALFFKHKHDKEALKNLKH